MTAVSKPQGRFRAPALLWLLAGALHVTCVQGAEANLPEVIALLLIDVCLENPVSDITCPAPEQFNVLDEAASSNTYREAVTTELQRQHIAEHVRRTAAEYGSVTEISLIPIGHAAAPGQGHAGSPMDTGKHYSLEFLLAGAIRGVNQLSFMPPAPGLLPVSSGMIDLISAFSLNKSGEPVFAGVLDRAKAARELQDHGGDPHFLRDREQWLYKGEIVQWQQGDKDLINAYFRLVELRNNRGRSY